MLGCISDTLQADCRYPSQSGNQSWISLASALSRVHALAFNVTFRSFFRTCFSRTHFLSPAAIARVKPRINSDLYFKEARNKSGLANNLDINMVMTDSVKLTSLG